MRIYSVYTRTGAEAIPDCPFSGQRRLATEQTSPFLRPAADFDPEVTPDSTKDSFPPDLDYAILAAWRDAPCS